MKVRAAVHVHSEWSYDARWSLAELARLFKGRGYDAVLLAEHDRGFTPQQWAQYRDCCAKTSSDEFLLIPGIEYSDAANVVHVTTWGRLPFLGEGRQTKQVLSHVSEHGGVASLAHPSRRAAWQYYHDQWSQYLVGIELWNRKTDGWAPSDDARFLLKRSGLSAIGAMDFHTPKQLFPLAMILEVEETLSETTVLRALASRRFHCEAFGRSVDAFAAPKWRTTLLAAEALRRGIARSTRFLRQRQTPAPKNVGSLD